MKIIEAISRADALKPNAYPQSDKVRWLSELDMTVYNEIIETHAGCPDDPFEGYDEDTDLDETDLLVCHPYDEMYMHWLNSKIDYNNAEYGKYNNDIEAFNELFRQYNNYYNQRHMPFGNKIKYF